MIRPLFLALAFAAAANADVAPETLLSPTTQIYYRWDGVSTHRDAYRKSARGQMLAGDTGKFIEDFYQRLLRKFVFDSFVQPLLGGQDVDELAAKHSQFRLASRLPQLLAETGVVAGFELRPPPLTLKNFGRMFGVSSASETRGLADVDLQFTFIVPDGADRKEIAAFCKLLELSGAKPVEVRHKDRVAQELIDGELHVSWWPEGKHFVVTVGTVAAKKSIDRLASAGEGITNHPLFMQLDRKQKFEVVSRAFGDGTSLWKVARLLLGGLEQGKYTAPLLDFSGLSGIQAVRLWEGFDGEESRSVTEVDVAGPREGITKLYKAGKFEMKDLPPLPADVHRWSAGVFDITAGYELLLGFYTLQMFDGEFKPGKESFLEKRQELAEEVDGVLGMKLSDLLATLGDLGVTYQSPGDGLLTASQVFAVRIKDTKEFKVQLGRFVEGLEKIGRNELKVTRRGYQGVETREFSLKDGGYIRPTVAICDGWMVWAFYPQPVHGFIQRSKGKLPTWKADERTAKALASIPPGPAAIQYSDPRMTVKVLLGGAQPFLGFLSTQKELQGLVDPSLLPNPDEACKHLFPNLVWTHNDGKLIRWETRESLALPFEIVGIEGVLGLAAASQPGIFRAVSRSAGK